MNGDGAEGGSGFTTETRAHEGCLDIGLGTEHSFIGKILEERLRFRADLWNALGKPNQAAPAMILMIFFLVSALIARYCFAAAHSP